MMLSKNKQLQLLRKTKKEIKVLIFNKTPHVGYMCNIIESNLNHNVFAGDVIPTFNRENADRICEQHGMEKPDGLFVWWHLSNLRDSSSYYVEMNKYRVKFLTILIKELKDSK